MEKLLKTAIIHEWLVNYAGSEKCVESFTNIWKDADVYALVDFLNDEERRKILKGRHAGTSFIQRLPMAKTKHRLYLPLFPLAIEQIDLSDYDVVLSSSHAVAKGVLTKANQLHICYCHTPMRYAWDLYHQYLKEAGLTRGLKSWITRYILHRIRIWDYTTANRVDYYIANSKFTARRIRKTYNRDAAVIYPPVDIDKFPLVEKKEDYYVTASRLVPYKRVDLVVDAFARMGDKKLIVIGDGPEMEKIKNRITPNIELKGYLNTEEMVGYIQKARAFVFAAEEDFGITPVEALACGTPVIALNRGGTAESITDGITGIHFEKQTSDDIILAVERFEKNEHLFTPAKLREYASSFSRENFEKNIKEFVQQKHTEFIKQ